MTSWPALPMRSFRSRTSSTRSSVGSNHCLRRRIMPDGAAESAELAGTILVVEDEVLIKSELAIDVVFTDVEMPGSMDGFALAQWSRSNRPDIDVILAGSVGRAVQ